MSTDSRTAEAETVIVRLDVDEENFDKVLVEVRSRTNLEEVVAQAREALEAVFTTLRRVRTA